MIGLDLQDRKLWIGFGAVAAMLIVVAAWVFAVGPKRSDTDGLRSQTADTIVQNGVLSAQNVALQRQSKRLPAYRAKLAKAVTALPPTSDLSGFTRSLARVAEMADVRLSSVAVGGVNAVTSAAAAPTDTTTSAASSSTSTSAVPAAAATSAAPGQLVATVTLQVSGSARNDLIFLEAVREGARSALVTSAQFTAADTGKPMLTAQVEVFSAPQSAGQLAQLRTLLASGK